MFALDSYTVVLYTKFDMSLLGSEALRAMNCGSLTVTIDYMQTLTCRAKSRNDHDATTFSIDCYTANSQRCWWSPFDLFNDDSEEVSSA